ncbi:hypothetical protein CYLTODRAFT_446580, partial [Cylindrobasidium torrendii FP15055 ss-10]
MTARTRIYSDNRHADEGMPRPVPTNTHTAEKDRSLFDATQQSQHYALPAAADTYSAAASCFATPHSATEGYYAPGAPVIPLNCDLSDSDDEEDEMDTSRFAAPARSLRRHAPVIPPSPTSSDSDLSEDDMPEFPRQFSPIYSRSDADPSAFELPSPFNRPLASMQPMFEASLPSPFNKPLAQFYPQDTNGRSKLHTLRTRGSVLLGDMAMQRDELEKTDYFEAPLSPLDLSDSPLSEEPQWPPA